MGETKHQRSRWLGGLFGRKRQPQTRSERPSARAIQQWLVCRVAEKLEVPPEQVDPREPFSNLGLDSRTSIALAGDLGEWLGREIPPTMVWDIPSIAAAAEQLAAQPDQSPLAAPVEAADKEGSTVAPFFAEET